MARWRSLISGLILMAALAGCGGGDKGKPDQGSPTPGVRATAIPTPSGPTRTPIPPAPRSREFPSGDPYTFEAPFSAGDFVRESMHGRATSRRTGGLVATYRRNEDVMALTVYYFDAPEQAIESVEFTLDSANIVTVLSGPYTAPAVAFGVGQDRQGGYLAVWSHYGWYFQVRTASSLEALNAFLEAFPF